MTDLSRFNGHTDGPWKDVWPAYSHDAEILVKSAIGETVANNADYELMSAAPALLARVRELEEFIDCELCEYIEELRREMLRAVHVDSDVRDIRYATELANKDVLADIKKEWL